MIDLDNVDISKWNIEEKEKSSVECMLRSLDPEHAIVIDKEIALVGYGFDEEPNMRIYTNGIDEKQLAILDETNIIFGFRGNYFLAIDYDCCILFNYYIKQMGILYGDCGVEGYIFVLKDYVKEDILADLLDDGDKPALVLYKNRKLYTNGFEVAEEIGETIPSLSLNYIGSNNYSLIVNGDIYRSRRLISNYEIYDFYKQKMQL